MNTLLTAKIELMDGVEEIAVEIPRDPYKLKGNLIHCRRADKAVLFLHGWGGLRSGPHDLLTFAARQLGQHGISSLRFDFTGRGESDGHYAQTDLDDMADDALAAARLLRERTGARSVFVVGICSGGNIAIGILDRMRETAGLFLISVYPFSDGDSFGRSAKRSFFYLKEYAHKLFRAETWRKAIRGAIDFRQILTILLGNKKKQPRKLAVEKKDNGHASHSPLWNLTQWRRPVRMVYGDADTDFQASLAYYRTFAEKQGAPLQFSIYPGANHNFYSVPWKKRLVDELLQFIKGEQDEK